LGEKKNEHIWVGQFFMSLTLQASLCQTSETIALIKKIYITEVNTFVTA